ncbi:MAG: glycosyltransferase family 4 protein [Bacteroidales bacterium]|nr:glycosyltransferase family 4 protein [Bacteroidales bacterium]
MKICFWGNISGALNGSTPGGGELQIALLAKALVKSGHEVVIIDPIVKKDFVSEDGIKVLAVHGWNQGLKGFRMIFNRIPGLYRALKSQKADYYYVRMRSYLHLIPYLAASKNKAGFIIAIASDLDVMGFMSKYKYEYKSSVSLKKLLFDCIPNDLVYNFLLRKADYVLIQHKGQLTNRLQKSGKTSIFPNNIDLDYIGSRQQSIGDYYIHVGSMSVLKGVDNLFNIINMVSRDIPFLIVGGARDQRAELILEKLKEFPNVSLVGRKNHAETIDLISRSKALINTSNFEGFPNTFLESWAKGIPVISLNSNPGNVLNDYSLGLFSNGDINQMKQQIESGEINSIDRDSLMKYVRENHNADSASNRFMKVLNIQ